MPGRAAAVISGVELQQAVENLGMHLGLEVRSQVRVGRRLWGSERKIDVVLIHPQSRRSLGLECKFQGGSGSADEKIPATISDIAAWPIQGLVVFAGEGLSSSCPTGPRTSRKPLRGPSSACS
jgi:hypothetical protein